MRQCLKRLVAQGIPIADFETAYKNLLALNAQAARSTDAVASFAQSLGADGDTIRAALGELTAPLPPEFLVPTTPFALEVIDYYRKKFPLALVTGGSPSFQMDKLKKAGIEPSFFSKMAIPEDSVKKPCFLALQKEFLLAPHEIWVCGDRIEMDLLPAKELGFQTVHMRWGRGAQGASWPGYCIRNLSELKGIIQ